jgi:hypothetical protein
MKTLKKAFLIKISKLFQEVTEASDKAKSKSFRDSSKRGGREREREGGKEGERDRERGIEGGELNLCHANLISHSCERDAKITNFRR